MKFGSWIKPEHKYTSIAGIKFEKLFSYDFRDKTKFEQHHKYANLW